MRQKELTDGRQGKCYTCGRYTMRRYMLTDGAGLDYCGIECFRTHQAIVAARIDSARARDRRRAANTAVAAFFILAAAWIAALVIVQVVCK